MFVQEIIRTYVNKFRAIGNSILDYFFDTIQCENLSDARYLREFYLREIHEICTGQAAHLFYCFHLNADGDIFIDMFASFKPEVG